MRTPVGMDNNAEQVQGDSVAGGSKIVSPHEMKVWGKGFDGRG